MLFDMLNMILEGGFIPEIREFSSKKNKKEREM